MTLGQRALAEMSVMVYFLPMRVVLVAFEGAQGLDVFGPAEVFAEAARHSDGGPPYEVVLAATGGGTVRATSGIALGTRDLLRLRPRPDDTVLVVGGDEAAIRAAFRSTPLRAWLARAASIVRRIGSVCSGAFVLAGAGVLDGRRAATHWSACTRLAALFPSVQVDANAIFVTDGSVWTSAGVTTGIDMALAMVEEDHGRVVADAIAARLVLYARRPGFQSQFSDVLVAQTAGSDPLGRAIAWARANIQRPVDVPTFARKAGVSVRSLHRRCAETLGSTPAKVLESLRVEAARTLLSTTSLGTKTVATRSGFGSAPRMTRAFERALGVTPRDYRMLHAG